MMLVAMVSLVESTGVYFALGDICERDLTKKDLSKVTEPRDWRLFSGDYSMLGAMIAMFGMVISQGIKMLGKVINVSQENSMIIACSVGIGLGRYRCTGFICGAA
jgi:xanthine permease